MPTRLKSHLDQAKIPYSKISHIPTYTAQGAASRKTVPDQPVDATPSGIKFFSKDGVYDVQETGEAFRKPAGRHVESLEGGTVGLRGNC
jgi:hypothetical protein